MAESGPSRALRASYAAALSRYMEAVEALSREALDIALVTRGGGPPRVGGLGQATDRLAAVIRETQLNADAIGRRETLEAARRIAASGAPPKPPDDAPPSLPQTPSPFGGGDGEPIPRVVYHEAVADVLAREPMLAAGHEAVAAAYNEQHAFAMARAVESTTVERAQRAVAKAIATGRSARQVGVELREIAKAAGEDMDNWTRWYAETVAENNMNTAYSAGRFRQMAEPAVASVIGALMFDGPMDSSTRPNHAAAVGLIAAPDDPCWNVVAPPLGHRCRHYLSFVNWETLRAMGLVLPNGRVRRATIPAGAHPDPGFRHTGRPDIAIYGGA